MLFMALTALKNAGSWDFLGAMFAQTGSTFSIRVIDFLEMLRPCLLAKYVVATAERWSMLKLSTTGNQFHNFPEARYAVDVTFQQTETPGGNFGEKKKFFSKKHGLYGVKVEVSVVPTGFAIGMTKHVGGRVTDKTIFDNNIDFHMSQLVKQGDEHNVRDRGPLAEEYPQQWAVLGDKGYQGFAEQVRGISPHKRPPGGILSMEQQQFNDEVSHDRVVVENYFGRLKTLWNVIGSCWKWDRSNYDLFFECCVALTNVHVRFNPLRDTDGKDYRRYLRRLQMISASIKAKKAEKQADYRANRKRKISQVFGLHDDEVEYGGSDADAQNLMD
ncbi:hypothetical protein P43SY_011509 [Pythium insidiosum]|uniref:DDE Tnp4 domain-containing protein n=1 Tax=Pythium insidiosum TaxID=114742 RepID=A0AAD5Q2S5_PYTIN|nr:hypothetical protein P43SY_011509 [Pythium insidiosum]